MNIKKTSCAMSIVFLLLIYANLASAQGYSLLVNIPGIPNTNVNMSMYLVGIYSFLLSIVGIVAVMMLIVGGMRYITAVGNSAAISDAKDIITNTIFGLLLALMSWVFISTINPDALYIKPPVEQEVITWNPECTSSLVPTADPCVCNDTTIINNPAAANCDTLCGVSNCALPSPPVSCVEHGYIKIADKNGICHCADRTDKLTTAGDDCQIACADKCLLADVKIGISDVSTASNIAVDLETVINSTSVDDYPNFLEPLYVVEGEPFSLLISARVGSVSPYINTRYDFDIAPPFTRDGNINTPNEDFSGAGYLGSVWVMSGDLAGFPAGMMGMWNAIQANPGKCKKRNMLMSDHINAWVCPISLKLIDATGGGIDSNVDVAYIGFDKPCTLTGGGCLNDSACCFGDCLATNLCN